MIAQASSADLCRVGTRWYHLDKHMTNPPALTSYYGHDLPLLQGLLIRGGDVLESASKLDTVIFDKTGTLTSGSPVLVEIQQVLIPPPLMSRVSGDGRHEEAYGAGGREETASFERASSLACITARVSPAVVEEEWHPLRRTPFLLDRDRIIV